MAKAKRKRVRRSGSLAGRARVVAKAPTVCKVSLSKCMRGKSSRAKKSTCMKSFNRCLGR